jgi:hypothetical protein
METLDAERETVLTFEEKAPSTNLGNIFFVTKTFVKIKYSFC